VGVTANSAEIQTPTVRMLYVPMLDSDCYMDGVGSASEAQKHFQHHPYSNRYMDGVGSASEVILKSIKETVPDLIANWEEDGTEMVKTLVELVKRPFPNHEYEVGLMTCPAMTSMSAPLLVNIRSVVPYFTNNQPYPPFAFTTYAFHELLHRFISHMDLDGPIFGAFKSEYPIVRNHIPVFFLQKLVLEKLDWTIRLEKLEIRDRQMGQGYSRAWDLVKQIPADKGLAEIQAEK
jgi:hypothetical protein